MRFEDGYVYWTEGEQFNITKNFRNTEFECAWTHADEQKISVELVAGLQWVRNRLGKPIKINSGFRTQAYQDDLYRRLGRKPLTQVSQHVLGNAADIGINSDDTLFSSFDRLVTMQFRSRGYASNFIHVDIRSDKERTWEY
jgi:flagellar protein FlgJ